MLEYIEIDTPQLVLLLESLQEGSTQELPLHTCLERAQIYKSRETWIINNLKSFIEKQGSR